MLVAQDAAARLEEVRAAGGLDESVRIGSLDRREPGDLAFDASTRCRLLRTIPSRRRPAATIRRTSSSRPARPGEPKGVVITHANVLAFLDWAVPHFGIGDGRSPLRPPAAPFRPVHVRHLRRAHGRRGAPPRAAGAQPAAEGDRALHRAARADAVVLGSVGPDLHGEVRRRPRRRLPDAPPRALLRRRAPDAGARALGRTAAARSLHESLRPDRGDDREQLPRDRRLSPGRNATRSRSAGPAAARSCSSSTRT